MGNSSKDSDQKHLHGDNIGRDKGTPNIPEHKWLKIEIEYVFSPEEPSMAALGRKHDVNPSTVQTHANKENWKDKREKKQGLIREQLTELSRDIEQRLEEVQKKAFRILSETFLVAIRQLKKRVIASDQDLTVRETKTLQSMMNLAVGEATEVHGFGGENAGWRRVKEEFGDMVDEKTEGEDLPVDEEPPEPKLVEGGE